MKESTAAPERKPMSSQTITAVDPAAGARRASRPCMALVTGTGSHLTEEVHCLLRSRLRMASLIGLSGFAQFLVKPYLFPSDHNPADSDAALPVLRYTLLALLVFLC